jgi:hypothetical protein
LANNELHLAAGARRVLSICAKGYFGQRPLQQRPLKALKVTPSRD